MDSLTRPVEQLHKSDAWRAQPIPVSAILITHNQRDYILAALNSLLGQTYPCQIIISDDASHDGTVRLMRERLASFKGHHDVRLRAGKTNVGVCRNQNAALELCSGELIVVFEGDDVSAAQRVTRLVKEYQRMGRAVGALASGIRLIRKDGSYRSTVQWPEGRADAGTMVRHQWSVHGCCIAFRRDCFSEIGPISRRLISGDNGLWLRAAFVRNGGVAQIGDALVDYRVHDANVSRGIELDYTNAETLRESCERLRTHEVALLFELRKIKAYLQRAGVSDEDLDSAWRELWQEGRARALLVSTVARGSKSQWVFAAMRAFKFPALRRFAVNTLALSMAPWTRNAYLSLLGRTEPRRIGA